MMLNLEDERKTQNLKKAEKKYLYLVTSKLSLSNHNYQKTALLSRAVFFAFPIVALLTLLRYIVVNISFFITLIKMPKQCLGD